ncbi:hypothetical protein NQ315_003878 [Exocentrus adspersus]|uniref:Nuclear pore complex NUP2/50/61 domain-containing protein n=1 Tax=Exocentrus adspersus TaxID=1586481 RepID=A0AAV8VYJ1_9CUCU|nr:hypothetical protein NQ315_003878 [Exocentrus adspersus]
MPVTVSDVAEVLLERDRNTECPDRINFIDRKRGATSDLNHDNWDQDEERENAGTFQKASEESLKKKDYQNC